MYKIEDRIVELENKIKDHTNKDEKIRHMKGKIQKLRYTMKRINLWINIEKKRRIPQVNGID